MKTCLCLVALFATFQLGCGVGLDDGIDGPGEVGTQQSELNDGTNAQIDPCTAVRNGCIARGGTSVACNQLYNRCVIKNMRV